MQSAIYADICRYVRPAVFPRNDSGAQTFAKQTAAENVENPQSTYDRMYMYFSCQLRSVPNLGMHVQTVRPTASSNVGPQNLKVIFSDSRHFPA